MESHIPSVERVRIGKKFTKRSVLWSALGLPFIYLPIIFYPFFMLSACMTWMHLRLMGAENIKGYGDFIPDWSSYRYTIRSQITSTQWSNPLMKLKLFWMLNCTLYCPYSVGLLAWHTYLVKVVENWWCPFKHDKKPSYADAPIDRSYWHCREGNAKRMDPEDRDNPIWNEDAGT